MPTALMYCSFCGAHVEKPCRSIEDMEKSNSRFCYDALMRRVVGSNAQNRAEAIRRNNAFEDWLASR